MTEKKILIEQQFKYLYFLMRQELGEIKTGEIITSYAFPEIAAIGYLYHEELDKRKEAQC